MKTVIVNESFRDRYNPDNIFKAGATYSLTEARVSEIKDVNPSLITVIGEERVEDSSGYALKEAEVEAAKEEAAAALEEAENAKKEAEKAKKEAEKLKKQLEELKKGDSKE